jgi:hypothetical protein
MSEETKIQNLTPQGSFAHQGAEMFKFDVILENGMVGEVLARSTNKWKEGDSVVVLDQKSSKWGNKLKLDRPTSQYGTDSDNQKWEANKPSAPQSDNRQDAIITQWAIREAQTFFVNTSSDPSKVSLRMIAGTALQFKQMAKDLDKYYEDSRQQPEATSDDLPF